MKVALLGGTKGIGRALARLLGDEGHDLCLLGRDLEDMKRSAADVKVRSNGKAVSVAYCDLGRPETFGPALDYAAAELDGFDCVVVTAAIFAPQETLESDRDLARELLTTNFAHTVLFCEEARERLLARGGGTLAVLSSVAGEQGAKAGGPVWRGEGRSIGLSRGARSQIPEPRLEDHHGEAGLREDGHDRGALAAAFRGRAGRSGEGHPRRDRTGAPRRLHTVCLEMGHAC